MVAVSRTSAKVACRVRDNRFRTHKKLVAHSSIRQPDHHHRNIAASYYSPRGITHDSVLYRGVAAAFADDHQVVAAAVCLLKDFFDRLTRFDRHPVTQNGFIWLAG